MFDLGIEAGLYEPLPDMQISDDDIISGDSIHRNYLPFTDEVTAPQANERFGKGRYRNANVIKSVRVVPFPAGFGEDLAPAARRIDVGSDKAILLAMAKLGIEDTGICRTLVGAVLADIAERCVDWSSLVQKTRELQHAVQNDELVKRAYATVRESFGRTNKERPGIIIPAYEYCIPW